MGRGRLIFVTGTDTGVGKTLLSAMLVSYLRKSGIHALAMKPFCSGGTGDVRLLRAAQDDELTAEEINPFYFDKPVAPLAAGKKSVPLTQVLRAVEKTATKCETLVVEGAGGVLVPLGKQYFVADLIAALNCDVVLVARNKLGTLNHTLLSCEALERRCVNSKLTVVLMGQATPDISSANNLKILRALLPSTAVMELPFLGKGADQIGAVRQNCTRNEKLLATIAART